MNPNSSNPGLYNPYGAERSVSYSSSIPLPNSLSSSVPKVGSTIPSTTNSMTVPLLSSGSVTYNSSLFPVSSTSLRPTSFLHALASTPSIPYSVTNRNPSTLINNYTSPLLSSSYSTSTSYTSTIDSHNPPIVSKLSIASQQMLSRLPRMEPRGVVENLIEEARQHMHIPTLPHKSDTISASLLDKTNSIYRNSNEDKYTKHTPLSTYVTKVNKDKNKQDTESNTTNNIVPNTSNTNNPILISDTETNLEQIMNDSSLQPLAVSSSSSSQSTTVPTQTRSRSASVSSSVSSSALDNKMWNMLSNEDNESTKPPKKPKQSTTTTKRRDSLSSVTSTESNSQLILNLPSPIVASFRRVVAAREDKLYSEFRIQEQNLQNKYEEELQNRMNIAETSLNELTDMFNQRIQALEQRQQIMEKGRIENLNANEAQLNLFEQENVHLRTKLMDLQTELSKAHTVRAQSEASLHDAISSRDTAEITVRALTTRIDDLLRVMENDRKHATTLQETVTKLQSELSAATQTASNEHTEVNRLRGRCAGLEASENTLRKQLEEVSALAAGDTGRLQREIARLSTALADSNVSLATREQELAGANDRIARLSAKIASEQEAHLRGREAWESEREEANAAMARARANWQAENNEVNAAFTRARAAWDQEKEEILASAAAAREEAANRAAIHTADLIKVHTAEIQALSAKEKALVTQLQEYTIIAESEGASAKRMSTELASTKDRVRALEGELETMKSQYRAMIDERDHVMQQLTHTENEYKRALTSASEANETRLTAALETAAADRAREVGVARHETASIRHSLNAAETEIESLRAELDKEREHSSTALNEAHAEIGRITERLRIASEASINALRSQWDHEKQRIDQDHEIMVTALRTEMTEAATRAQQRLDEEHERYTKLSAMYDSANERIRTLESDALMLRQTIAEHRTELAHERAERHADATKYEKEITQLNNTIDNNETQIRTLTTEISSLSISLTEERNTKEQNIKDLDTLNRTHRETVDYATKLEQVVDEARSRLVAFERSMTELREARDTDVQALQEALREARGTIGELTSSLEQQRSLLITERDISQHLRTELTTANERESEARTFATAETARASRLQTEANQANLTLQAALTSAVTDLEHRVELVASLEAHTTELKGALEDARARADKFSAEARISAAEATHAQAEAATARTNTEIVTRTLEETRTELAALHKAHTETLNDIRELRTALGSREGECAALTRRLESAAKESEAHIRTIEKMNTERQRLEEELNNSRRENVNAQAAVTAARLEVEKAQAEKTNAEQRMEGLRAEVSVLLDRVERAENSMKIAQQGRADAESRAAELGRETSEARRNLASNIAELQEAHAAVERFRNAEKRAKDEAELLRAEAAKGRPDVDRVRGDLERTRMENDRVHDELRATKSELERIRADAARHAIQENKYRTEAGNLHVETERAKGEAERYRAEAERGRSEIERLRTEYASSISGDGRMRLEMERLRATITENEGIITGLRDRIRSLVDESRDNSARVIAMETQVRDTQELLRIKNAEIRNYEKDIAGHKARNEEMEREIRTLRSDIKHSREETAKVTSNLRDTSRSLEEALRTIDQERQTAAEIRHHAGNTVAEASRVRREAEAKAVEAVAAADAELDSVTARAAERIADVTRTAEERITLATRRADEVQHELANKETYIAKLMEMITEYSSGMNTLRETVGLSIVNIPGNNTTFISNEVLNTFINKGNIQTLSADIRRNIRELTDFITVLRRKSTTNNTDTQLSKSTVTLPESHPSNFSTSITDVLNNSTNSIRSLRQVIQNNNTTNNNIENIPPILNNSTMSTMNNVSTTSKSFSIYGIRPLPSIDPVTSTNKNTVLVPTLPTSQPTTPLRNSTINGIRGWNIDSKPPANIVVNKNIINSSNNTSMNESVVGNIKNETIIPPPPAIVSSLNVSNTESQILPYSQLDDSQLSIDSPIKSVHNSIQKLQNNVTTLNTSIIPSSLNNSNNNILIQSSTSPKQPYEPSRYIAVHDPVPPMNIAENTQPVESMGSPSSPSSSRIFVRVRAEEDKAPLPVIESPLRSNNSDSGFASMNNNNVAPVESTSIPIPATALESAFPTRSGGGVRRGTGKRTVGFTDDNISNTNELSESNKNIVPTDFPSLPSSRSSSSIRDIPNNNNDSLNSSNYSSRPSSTTSLSNTTTNNTIGLSPSLAVLDTATVNQLLGASRNAQIAEERAQMAEFDAQRIRYAAEQALQVMSNAAIIGNTNAASVPSVIDSGNTNSIDNFNNALGKAMELASKVNLPSSRSSSNNSLTVIIRNTTTGTSNLTTSASPARSQNNNDNNTVPSSNSRPVPRPLVRFEE